MKISMHLKHKFLIPVKVRNYQNRHLKTVEQDVEYVYS